MNEPELVVRTLSPPHSFAKHANEWATRRAVKQRKNPFGSGIPFIKSPYGDQVIDNRQIQNGIKAYQSGCIQ